MNLKSLNEQQLHAVTYETGSLLIVAGAGTGKTTVITQRVAWLIENKKAKADEILALTFTDKAAGEMEERVDKLLPYGYVDLWIMTFHSFCQRILQQHGLDIGISNDFKLLNQTEQWMLVRQNLDKFNLDYYRPLGNPTKFIHALIKHFSRCKDEEIWPADYLEYAEKFKINLDSMEALGGTGSLKHENMKTLKQNQKLSKKNNDEIKRLEEIANAFHIYQQLLLDNNSLDFGDLINYTLKLFRSRPNILKHYQNKFKYILVDEFQDTNWAQYELVKLLAGDDKNLTVVGDDDQCLPGYSLIDTPTGKKRIKNIKPGDEVVTAVGKGHLGIQKVNKVFKNKKQAILLTIKLKNGEKIEVTDNHKMFCYVPKKSDKRYYYVYLMYRQGLGWRIGVTNNLAVRLKLERSADKILAVRAFDSEEQARYYETVWSLTYGIPTVCFKERDRVIVKGEWVKKLYQEIDVENNIKKFAQDLNIDLSSHHYCLDAVTRGNSRRIIIHLEMCYRKYRSKEHVKKKRELIKNPSILHKISLETSNQKVIKKLIKAGFKLRPAKKGKRLFITSSDIKKIGNLALELQKITDGFIENKFNLGRINYQHLPALIMPAKNLVKGHYLPVRKGRQIFYEQIVDIKSKKVNQTVYDLEIDRTHNFITNGVVVHNSIYKFRGASVSNILQFKDNFPESKEIYLNKNYRSAQNILDLAYNFIQLNNPERLEVKLTNIETRHRASLQDVPKGAKKNLSKKLESQTNEKGIIEHLYFKTEREETEGVVNKILELYNQNTTPRESGDPENKTDKKGASWNDFAILVRANNQAEPFLNGLREAEIPFNFVASKGLYSKDVIMDILAYLKLLDNYHESLALWRILNLPMVNIKPEDLMEINRFANRKTLSLFEALKHVETQNFASLQNETKRKINKILNLLSEHTRLAKEKSVKKVVLKFLEDYGYSKYLLDKNDNKSFVYINQLGKKIDEFEKSFDDKSVKKFISMIDLEMESGESGDLSKELEEGPESVKVMTIHSAKGLEFKYVFIVNLVDKRLPSIERKDPIELPDELVKEIIPTGDIHLQEERRLFYVAMTRAKTGLFFTSAQDYGGQRKKKLSRFLYELSLSASARKTGSSDFSISAINSSLSLDLHLATADKLQNFLESEVQCLDRRFNQTGKKQKALNMTLPAVASFRLKDKFLFSKDTEKYKGSALLAKVGRGFSYSQLKAFETCPYQYYLQFILKIPVEGKATFSFGKTMHTTLQKFFSLIKQSENSVQGDLFSDKRQETRDKRQIKSDYQLPTCPDSTESPRSERSRRITNYQFVLSEVEGLPIQKLPSIEMLLDIYKTSWIDDWYQSKQQKEDYKKLGEKSLKNLYEELKQQGVPQILEIEKGFNFKIDNYTIKGVIDRIDLIQNNAQKTRKIQIIDYKTGSPKSEKYLEKDQLLIYQMACQETFGWNIEKLTFYYLNDNSKISFLGNDQEIKKMKDKILELIRQISSQNFIATPSEFKCKFCDFKNICSYRK